MFERSKLEIQYFRSGPSVLNEIIYFNHLRSNGAKLFKLILKHIPRHRTKTQLAPNDRKNIFSTAASFSYRPTYSLSFRPAVADGSLRIPANTFPFPGGAREKKERSRNLVIGLAPGKSHNWIYISSTPAVVGG
jgi:hypothetical protein